jgi:hypothetical protein
VQGPKNETSIAAVGELISRYQPQILVLEDNATNGCRRRDRVRKLIEILDLYGREHGLTIRKVAQSSVKRTFSQFGVRNKDQLARFVAARFLELARHVPPSASPG